MKVLLALDGSPASDSALELAASIDWPPGSTLRLLTVIEIFDAAATGAWTPGVAYDIDRQDDEATARGDQLLEQATRRLKEKGIDAGWSVVHGRPASTIVEDATAFGADLVVMGSRGHGTIASMVLGSVSAEVADHSPCPVLVTRSPRLTRVILGADGSEYAIAAEDYLARWPIFASSTIEAISVAQSDAAWRSGIALAGYAPDVGDDGVVRDQIKTDHQHIADQAVERLASAGRHAVARVVDGDAASELIRVARDEHADLIVLGTHGRTGLSRLLLGSVARNVMLHAPCSVLVVRRRPN
jgi:nucleotide-binding universal stress UspA family protein